METNNDEWLVCDDCGEAKPDVVETHCPYAEDIYGKYVPLKLCDNCYHERLMDI